MTISKTNHEGYDDPTAYQALTKIEREERLAGYEKIVFICSPYAGDIVANTIKAREYAAFAIRQGMVPIAPHLLYPQVLHEADPLEREIGLHCGLASLQHCDELWAFGGQTSEGMKKEIAIARERQIPLRFFDGACREVQPFG